MSEMKAIADSTGRSISYLEYPNTCNIVAMPRPCAVVLHVGFYRIGLEVPDAKALRRGRLTLVGGPPVLRCLERAQTLTSSGRRSQRGAPRRKAVASKREIAVLVEASVRHHGARP